jgi:putative addiction module component (TIGR02574 family)
MTKAQLLEDAKSLSTEDRIDLAMQLWDTLQPVADDVPISPSLRQELRRRVAEDESQPAPAEDWSQLRAKLLRGEI